MAETPNVLISMPTQPFTMARSFKACANGKIYIGKVDTDPTLPQNQLPVYIENECGKLVQVSQPININAGGFPVYVGKIVKFVTTEAHSMLVNDAYGSTQFYYSNVFKSDPSHFFDGMTSYDGFKYVGQVPSYADLKNITPQYAGQQILLRSYYVGRAFGGGAFEAVAGSEAEDGGYICSPVGNSGLYWRRILSEGSLHAEHFGAYPDSERSNPGTDCTKQLNNLAASSIKNGLPIKVMSKLIGSVSNERGYFITSPLMWDNVHIIEGHLLVHFKSSTFDTSYDNHQILLGDPKTNYTTIRDGLKYQEIALRDLDKRAGVANGIYVKYSHLHGSMLRAVDCNGSGVEFAPIYDSAVSVTTERCGNASTYAIFCNSNGDECNSVTWTEVLCHDSYHKGVLISGSKHNLVRVHCEATAVLTTDDGYTGITGATTSTGLKYVNHIIYLVDGVMGEVSFNDYAYADGKTYYDDQASFSGSAGSHVAVALVDSSTQNISNAMSTGQGGAKGRISFFSSNTVADVDKCKAGYIYAEATSRIHFSNINAGFFSSWSQYTSADSGYIADLNIRVQGTFRGVRFNSALSLPDTSSWIIACRCEFTNGIANLSGNNKNEFSNCVIPSVTLTSSSMSEACTFNKCDIGSSGGLTINNGTSTALYKEVVLDGCTMRGNWNMNSNSFNRSLFIGNTNKRGPGAFNITGYALPPSVAVGIIAATISNSYVSGSTSLSQRTVNNSDGSGTWTTIISIP